MLQNESPIMQEYLLIEDILDIMLGFDGVYIKKRVNSNHFIIEPHLENPSCSLALAQMADKILDLPVYYYVIESYMAYYSLEQGTVCQALCGGLRHLIKEYKMMVVQLEELVTAEGMTLQKMWYHIQSSLRVIKSLHELVISAEGLKGGNLISCIMKLLHNTTDKEIADIYNYLFGKTLNLYVEMVSAWIYEGIIH